MSPSGWVTRCTIALSIYYERNAVATTCNETQPSGSTPPRLALNLIRVAWRFRASNWYRQFPFLPLPDPTYLRWRMYTAYGNYGAVPSAADVERYARWANASE